MFTNVGKRIRALRKGLGMTQVEFAAKVGVAQYHLSHWETGKLIPKAESVARISFHHHVPIHWLLGIKPVEPTPEVQAVMDSFDPNADP